MIENSMTFKGGDLNSVQRSKEKRDYNYSYDCTGNINKMRTAGGKEWPKKILKQFQYMLTND